MGSKNRHAKEILTAISTEIGCLAGSQKYNVWIEPFVGGANMIDKVYGMRRRIGIDSHPYLISLLQALQAHWVLPTTVTEQEYQEAKKNSGHWMGISPTGLMAWEVGFIGFCCSYSGKWFGGYARGNDSKGVPRNYAKESADNLNKQRKNLTGVQFYNGDYMMAGNLNDTDGAIIYCDPPYNNTTKYSNQFNHQEFWEWCDKMTEKGHKVFVSEYNAPEGWRCIWQKEVNNSLTKETGSKRGIEKLFTK